MSTTNGLHPMAPPTWSWPTSPSSSPPKQQQQPLHRAASLAAFPGAPSVYHWEPMSSLPPSPQSMSRSETPVLHSNNPWPRSPPVQYSQIFNYGQPISPPSTSRCATPVAPRPVHPPIQIPRTPFQPASPPSEHQMSPPTPVQSSNYNRLREIPSPNSLLAMPLTNHLISELSLSFPSLLSRQGWDRATAQICYMWALKNPRTALLLYMTNNLGAWPVAAIFAPLEDKMMPFSDYDVKNTGIHDWRKVLEVQGKVIPRQESRRRHRFRHYDEGDMFLQDRVFDLKGLDGYYKSPKEY